MEVRNFLAGYFTMDTVWSPPNMEMCAEPAIAPFPRSFQFHSALTKAVESAALEVV